MDNTLLQSSKYSAEYYRQMLWMSPEKLSDEIQLKNSINIQADHDPIVEREQSVSANNRINNTTPFPIKTSFHFFPFRPDMPGGKPGFPPSPESIFI